MHVFITGASGWIGSAVTDHALAAGHRVVGLARSDAAAAALEAKGATVIRGDLDDLDSIRRGAAESDAVIHLANKHDWSNPANSNAAERAAVDVIGDTLQGSRRPFLLASGVAGLQLGRPTVETDPAPFHGPDAPRGGSENLALEYLDRGVQTVSLRFAPTVHGVGDGGFVASFVQIALAAGVSGYIGDGTQRWPAVHRSDAAALAVLALENPSATSIVHAVGEEGVPTRAIAEAIGRAFDLPVSSIAPEDASAHFGFLGGFFAMDLPASSEATRRLLGWEPAGPTLIDDIDAGAYRKR